MPTRKELKLQAKAQLGGRLFDKRWLTAMLVCLAAYLVHIAFNAPSIVFHFPSLVFKCSGGVLWADVPVTETQDLIGSGVSLLYYLLVAGAMEYGTNRIFLKQTRDGEQMAFFDLFRGFREDYVGNIILSLMISVVTLLWSLLLVVPGIVKALAYAMAFYVKYDHPEFTLRQCMKESARLMNGHKGELFVLQLSFLGWELLGVLCCGIGLFWVNAYRKATEARFYQALLDSGRTAE